MFVRLAACLFALLVVFSFFNSSLSFSETMAAEVTKPAALPAGEYVIDPYHTAILWQVSHMGFSDYIGRFNDVEASLTIDPIKPAEATLTASIKADSIYVNHPSFGEKLQGEKFFDVEKFPQIQFTAQSIKLQKADRAQVEGELTFLGQTKPITLAVKLNKQGINPHNKVPTLGFESTTRFKRSDFGMDYLVPMIGDEVTVTIQTEFMHKESQKPQPDKPNKEAAEEVQEYREKE